MDGASSGLFNTTTGEIYYKEGAGVHTVIHEFGHALITGEFENEDCIVMKVFSVPELKMYNGDESEIYCYTLFHGSATEEAVVDIFSENITGERSSNTRPYAPIDYHTEMYMKACNYSIQELVNEGALGFSKAMIENDINNPISVLDDEDHLLSRYNIYDYSEEFPKYSVTINSVAEDFFEDWATEKFERGEEDIIERAEEIISTTIFPEGVAFRYKKDNGEYGECVDSSNPEELIEIVNKNLREVDKSHHSGIKDYFEDMFR